MDSEPLNPVESKKTIDLRLLLAGILCLGLGAFTAARIANGARQAAEKSRANLNEVERLVEQISRSQTSAAPKVIVEFGHSGEAIAKAKQLANISDRQNPLISDLGIQPIANSEFSIQPTEVKFRGLKMEQIIKFLLSVGQGEQCMAVKNMSFASNRKSTASQELWDLELVLTTTAFSRTNKDNKRQSK